jgi:hypothetical protein
MDTTNLEIQSKIQSLQEAILAVHPTLPIILRDIHKILKEDPAVVTILQEDEIAIIVSGLKQQTKTEITQASLKKKTPLKNVGLADL